MKIITQAKTEEEGILSLDTNDPRCADALRRIIHRDRICYFEFRRANDQHTEIKAKIKYRYKLRNGTTRVCFEIIEKRRVQ